MKKILVIEDEQNIQMIIKDTLEDNGFNVITADDGEDGLDLFYSEKPDLIILDVMMPNKNGWEVCEEVKSISKTPIIMLTARTTEEDELKSFERGANDYIKKPFSLNVLLARVNRLLHLTGGSIIKIHDLEIDENKRSVDKGSETLVLSPKEYEFLIYLVEHRGIALSREKILNEVWDFDFYGDDRTIDTHVKSLRKKIGSKLIETVRGVGYRFKEE